MLLRWRDSKINDRRGVAMFLAIMTVSLTVAVVTSVAIEQSYFRHTAATDRLRGVSEQVAMLALWQTIATLADPEADHPTGADSMVVPFVAPDLSRDAAIQIVDAQGKLNLNNLVLTAGLAEGYFNAVATLLENDGASEVVADAIFDWIDADETARPRGAEDPYYRTVEPIPYRTANRPFAMIAELRMVKDVDENLYRSVTANIDALPYPTPVNVNTASAELIAALTPVIPIKKAEALVASRNRFAFRDLADFFGRAGLPTNSIYAPYFTVRSQFFHLRIEATCDTVRTLIDALVRIDDEKQLGDIIYLRRS